jgi:hypothetical protein
MGVTHLPHDGVTPKCSLIPLARTLINTKKPAQASLSSWLMKKGYLFY